MRTTNAAVGLGTAFLWCSIATLAQSGGAHQQPEAANSTEVTVIGCLMPLDDSAWRPGTSAGADRSATLSSAGFALKDAAIVSPSSGASGEVSKRSEREFHLAKTKVQLQKFSGQQIEVKARLGSGDGTGTSSGDSASEKSAAKPSEN